MREEKETCSTPRNAGGKVNTSHRKDDGAVTSTKGLPRAARSGKARRKKRKRILLFKNTRGIGRGDK